MMVHNRTHFCSGWRFLWKRFRCLLPILAIVGLLLSPLQVWAQSQAPMIDERKGEQSNQEKSFARVEKGIRIEGNKAQREGVLKLLRNIYSTKEGKEFLDRIPLKGLTICFTSSGKYGDFCLYEEGRNRISMWHRFFAGPYETSRFFHELQHYSQGCEGRRIKRERGDGIGDFADFATRKLAEVEARLFEAVCLFRVGGESVNDRSKVVDYYKGLEEKYREQGMNEDEASRSARTEFVQNIWESTADNPKGTSYFGWWAGQHNPQFIVKRPNTHDGKRDIQREHDIIQRYIESMGVNLDVSYFLNEEGLHLAKDVRAGFERIEKEVKIEGNQTQRERVIQALKNIYSIKEGKKFLDRIPLEGLVFSSEEELPKRLWGLYGGKRIRLMPGFSSGTDGTATLFHELQHYAQDCEGRDNKCQKNDGIEGYADFVICKLGEVEAKLFEAVYIARMKERATRTDNIAVGEHYKELEEKYRGQGLNEDEVSRAARTEFVQNIWESAPGGREMQKGTAYFGWWAGRYNPEFINRSLGTPDGKRDIQKEYDMIQGYIKSMDVNLDVAYFLDTEKWHLSRKVQAKFDSLEKKCSRLRGTCLQLCKPGIDTNGVERCVHDVPTDALLTPSRDEKK